MSILNPLFQAVAWVMMRIHQVLAVPFGASSGVTWGLSIVILVLLMRLLMLPLFIKQVKSQRKMQAHMPQLQEIRKRYKHDKQKLNEETMKFYKENGINPLGGCLPLVAQLPLFWALFEVLKSIAEWKLNTTPSFGLTTAVVTSARNAHVFGISLADTFLRPVAGESATSRWLIVVFVLVSAGTTFLTMRQSSKRGMLNQTPADPDQPGAAMAASMSKNMMYIAPLFALTGLYWQFGLVIYWVTTNLWTLGQQHILFRNLPVVGSANVGASAVQPASGSAGAAVKSGAGPAVKSGLKSGAASAKPADKGRVAGSGGGPAKPKASASNASAAKAGANGAAVGGPPRPAPADGAGRSLLRLGRSKPEPEAVPSASQPKTVRQQPVRQTRSKRKR